MRERTKELQKQWAAAQPLQTEYAQRLWSKLRLEWNYNSNHIEGNTLTYGETMLLLLHGETTGTHTLREYEEMKAHDVAIGHVRELAASDVLMTEADMRNLNRLILKEPFWKEAITAGGQATRKEIIPGIYKTSPNSVRTKTNDIFHYASPLETPIKMQELMDWLSRELSGTPADPIALAAHFHHRFVLIHPFDDGNGRVARLVTNYILLKCGFPPIIVKSADKETYLASLRLADAGEMKPLVDYFEDQTEWALNLAMRAARGESVEEPSDVEKELELFIRAQANKPKDRPVPARLSPETARQLCENGLEDLIELYESRILKLAPLFAGHEVVARLPVRDDRENWRTRLPLAIENVREPMDFSFEFHFRDYRGAAPLPFSIVSLLLVLWREFECIVQYEEGFKSGTLVQKRYSERITPAEMDIFVSEALKKAFASIKSQAGP